MKRIVVASIAALMLFSCAVQTNYLTRENWIVGDRIKHG